MQLDLIEFSIAISNAGTGMQYFSVHGSVFAIFDKLTAQAVSDSFSDHQAGIPGTIAT